MLQSQKRYIPKFTESQNGWGGKELLGDNLVHLDLLKKVHLMQAAQN